MWLKRNHTAISPPGTPNAHARMYFMYVSSAAFVARLGPLQTHRELA
jgi:hypothetical protein